MSDTEGRGYRVSGHEIIGIQLSYSSTHDLYNRPPKPESWEVKVTVACVAGDHATESSSDEELFYSCPDGRHAIGSAEFMVLRLDHDTQTYRSDDLLDDPTDAGRALNAVIFDRENPGEVSDAFHESTSTTGDILVLKEFSLTGEWRGYGLRVPLLFEMIDWLGRDIAACVTYMPDDDEDIWSDDMRDVLSEIGFQPLPNSVFILDPLLTSTAVKLKTVRARVEELTALRALPRRT